MALDQHNKAFARDAGTLPGLCTTETPFAISKQLLLTSQAIVCYDWAIIIIIRNCIHGLKVYYD